MTDKKEKKQKAQKRRQIYYPHDWLDPYMFDEHDYSVLAPILEESPYLTPERITGLNISTEWKIKFLLSCELLNRHQLTGLAIVFAEHVLPLFEQYAPEIKDAALCLDVMRRYTEGEATSNDLHAAATALDDNLMILDHEVGLEHYALKAGGTVLGLASLSGEDKDEDFEEILVEIAERAQKATSHYNEMTQRMLILTEHSPDKKIICAHGSESEWQLERIVELLKIE
jgi:hypothetical protein